jgi:hypothetical protein
VFRTYRTAALFLVCLAVTPAHADLDFERTTLRGIPGVEVSIESFDPEVERYGLGQTTLQTDVELRLRQAGIRIMPRTPESTSLYVNVTILRVTPGFYAYSGEAHLSQFVMLHRDPKTITSAKTWSAVSRLGWTPTAKLATNVRDTVRDLTDSFINAYLAANPK